jgi:hypothetical protein
MWLFFVETYIFVLIAFALGAAVGLTVVRVAVRRIAPPRGPKAPKAPKAAKQTEKKRGKRGKAEAAEAVEAGREPAVAGETS